MFFFSPLKRKIESPRRRNSNFHSWVTRLPIEMDVHVVHTFWRLLQIPAFSLLPSKNDNFKFVTLTRAPSQPVALFYQELKKNSSKNVHALFLVFFHFLLWKTVQNIVIEKQPCILKTLQAKQNKMKNAETKRLWHRQSKSSFKIRFMLGAAEGGWGTKRTATSSPVMCLQISVAYPSQPRISPHWFRCILHTACTLFLGADLKYNPPPYLRKLTHMHIHT